MRHLLRLTQPSLRIPPTLTTVTNPSSSIRPLFQQSSQHCRLISTSSTLRMSGSPVPAAAAAEAPSSPKQHNTNGKRPHSPAGENGTTVAHSNGSSQRGHHNGKKGGPSQLGAKRQAKKQKSKREKDMKDGTNEEVLLADLHTLIKKRKEAEPEPESAPAVTSDHDESAVLALPEKGTEIEVEVLELSSTGDGLAVQKDSPSPQIYVVPFVTPGDIARVKVWRHEKQHHIPTGDMVPFTAADYISVVTPGPLRDDSRINCKYFAQCSGCQFQMLDYSEQLRHKRSIVVKAYRNFSNLPQELVPEIGDTVGSPLQYGYRTKLTPHFDGPPGRKKSQRKPLEAVPNVGYNKKGTRSVMDIEDCPIGTDAVRLGMKRERKKVARDYATYKSGATILLRESTQRYPKKDKDGQPLPLDNLPDPQSFPPDSVRVDTERFVDVKTCETLNKAMTTEYIDDYRFTNPAGSFFQNNNSILSPFTAYVKERILPPAATSTSFSSSSSSTSSSSQPPGKQVKHLIDAYSGSGLFTITLSGMFETSTGIDISADSIASAKENARLNNMPSSQVNFMAADAPELFKHVSTEPDETVVVIDPPRKGCDNNFLAQLLRFGPKRVVYVSCNVHTQARDVGIMVRGEVEGYSGVSGPEDEAPAAEDVMSESDAEGKQETRKTEAKGTTEVKQMSRYEIESIRGFDFFPQTGHVEGVAVLNRVDDE